jgi:hypothetical protein
LLLREWGERGAAAPPAAGEGEVRKLDEGVMFRPTAPLPLLFAVRATFCVLDATSLAVAAAALASTAAMWAAIEAALGGRLPLLLVPTWTFRGLVELALVNSPPRIVAAADCAAAVAAIDASFAAARARWEGDEEEGIVVVVVKPCLPPREGDEEEEDEEDAEDAEPAERGGERGRLVLLLGGGVGDVIGLLPKISRGKEADNEEYRDCAEAADAPEPGASTLLLGTAVVAAGLAAIVAATALLLPLNPGAVAEAACRSLAECIKEAALGGTEGYNASR